MDSANTLKFRQNIRQRGEAISHQWYRAIASVGGFNIDRAEALQMLSQLTDQVITFLLAENPDGAAAREIGVNLASLHCIDPLVLEMSGQLWAGQLVEGVYPAEHTSEYPRLAALLNGMAAGFARRAREIVLAEQEDIRSAMAANLLRTTEELRKYQLQLEGMLADRTLELRESEEQFRAIAETSMDGIFQSTDDAGKLLFVNDAFAKMLGYTKEELLGRNTISLIAEVELPKLSPIAEDVRVTRPVAGEFRLKHKDGHLVDIHFSVIPTVLNGRIVRSGILQDITERKKAECALHESEEKYRNVIEKAFDGITIIQDGIVKFANPRLAEMRGEPLSQIIGSRFEEYIHPDERMKVSELYNQHMAGDYSSTNYETDLVHKDNSRVSVELSAGIIQFGGRPADLVVVHDISERKKAERDIRESEETGRVILNATNASLMLLDAAGTIILANSITAQRLGKRLDEIVGICAFDFFPEDVAKARKLQMDKVFRTGKVAQFEDFRQGIWFENHFYPIFDSTGKVTRVVVSARDITERKRAQNNLLESEERYRTLAEASPDMIYIIGRDDRIQYVNSFAAAFLNLPVEEIIGQPRERFFRPPTSRHQKKNIMKVLKNGKTSYAEEEASFHGQSRWHGTWLVPLRDVSGNISGVMGVSRDITAHKHTELEILRSRDQLEKRVEERTTDLIASQSQLRQLTNQLITALEEERRRISRELHDEAGQALISLYYSLALIESDIPESNILARQRLVDSMDIIDQVMNQIRTLTHSLRPPVLEIGGIDMSLKDYCEEFTQRTGLPIRYQGEEVPGLPDEIGISLYRFVQEALTNILKHAQATKVEVVLQYRKKQIALSVSDNGRGMADTTQSDGIGLIGIEERFKLLGGSLQIHSRKGQGVKISVYAPWPKPVEKE